MDILVDYKVGNCRSVLNLFDRLGRPLTLSADSKHIAKADLLVLPGQGAFDTGMRELQSAGLVDSIKRHVLAEKPFLGICLGFQLLFESSPENGGACGLGIFPGVFAKFDDTHVKVPHMGWNQLHIRQDTNTLYAQQDPSVYFVHSYYLPDTAAPWVSAVTTYDVPFVSAIQTARLFGAQFHPEKSGAVGVGMIEKFVKGLR
jgi:glutamine amidotransferase